MIDFLTLYHDEIRWALCMMGLVLIGFFTDWGTFEKHKLIKWKVRWVALLVISVTCLVLRNGFWTVKDVLLDLAFAGLIWFVIFFPPWYFWDLFKSDDDNKNK